MSLQWHGGQPGSWQGNNAQAMMRASNSDRDRAADVLKAALAEGRLTKDEFDQRMVAAYKAMTYGELQNLLADLPQGPVPAPLAQPAAAPVPRTFRPAPPPTTNSSALGSLICGVLTPMTWGLTAIPAVALGHKARSEIRRTGQSGDGMAVAGLVIGYLALACGALFFLAVVLAAAAGA